jgi:outer membrane murein-binding lipoprotein Lpp
MKKLLSIFAVVALVAMFGCKQEGGVSQEEFDKLSKQVVDKDTEIAQLQDELELLMADFDLCNMERDSLVELTTKKGTKTGTKPATTTTTTTTTTGGKGDIKDGGTTTSGGKGGLKDGGKTTTTTTTTGGKGGLKTQ